jgi:type I restriction enzyme S subunit
MGGEWRETTLGEVAEFLSGGTPSKARADYWAGSVPWVSAKDMKRFRLDDAQDHLSEEAVVNATTLAPAGSVLLLARGMTLLNDVPICVINRPMTFNQDVKALRPRPQVRSDYLPYLVLGNKERLLSLVDLAGHGTGRLNTDELKALAIAIPPPDEQRAIAHILGTLDDKIELNRRMSETLEAMARALFKSWFVDFDPVRAKAEGRDPGLPQPLADLFPDSFEDSELGEIPRGWEVKPLGELIETVKGRSYKSEELVESDTALVTLKSFARGGGYRPEGLKSFAGTYRPEQVVKPGEIVIACTDVTQAAEVIGRPAMVRQSTRYQRLVASLDTLIVRPKDGGMTTRAFVYLLCSTDTFTEHTYAHSAGTTVLHLAKEAVPSFRFSMPSEKLAQAFDLLAAPILARIQDAELESETLAALRDTLLPKLISGELRVKDAEGFLKERAV